MAYIGVSPSNGVRRKHTYTATANQTSFSGAGAEGATLSYNDSNFVDVYQNGVKLSEADYTSTSGTAIVLAQGASVSDIVEIVVYDVFSVADTVSKADGGTFDGAVTANGGAVFNENSADVDFRVESNDSANMLFVNGGNNQVGIGVDPASTVFHVETSTDGTGVSGDELYIAKFYNKEATDDRSYGIDIHAGSTATDQSLRVKDHDGTNEHFLIKGNGEVNISRDNIVFKTAGKGIHLGVTSATASNLLDDYEEGTWTPGFSGNIAFSTAANFTYTKIGRVVHTTGYLSGKSGTFGTGWSITGLPFAGNANYNLVPLWSHGVDLMFMGYINGSSSSLNIRDRDNANMNSISELGIQFTYTT